MLFTLRGRGVHSEFQRTFRGPKAVGPGGAFCRLSYRLRVAALFRYFLS